MDVARHIRDICPAPIGPNICVLHHLAEADDGVERRAQLMAHIGEEFRLRPVGRLGAGLLARIFVGEIGEALRLLLGEEALLLQVAHRHHQFAFREQQPLLVLLERRDVGADRDEAAILGAPLVDLQPASVAELHLEGVAFARDRGCASACAGAPPAPWRLGDHLIGRARHADAGRQRMELLVLRIAQDEPVVGIPQHEGFGDILDRILEPELRLLVEPVGELLRGDVDGDADEMRRLFARAHATARRGP